MDDEDESDIPIVVQSMNKMKKKRPIADSPVPSSITSVERVNVDFKKIQVIQMGAGSAVKEPWLDVLDEVVVRMSRITMLASRFLIFYIARMFSTDATIFKPPIPTISIFQKEFFEHLFKVVTFDTTIDFEPTLYFVRCLWLHALLLKHDAVDLEPMDETQLWDEIQTYMVNKTYVKTRNKHMRDEEKKEIRDGRPKKKIKLDNGVAADVETIHATLAMSIVNHPALANLLPSCSQINQSMQYASVAYHTAFVQYQSTGLRAHIGWFLYAKYQLSKKKVRQWLETHFPTDLIKHDDEQENESEIALDANMEKDLNAEIENYITQSIALVNKDRRTIFNEIESKKQLDRLTACLLLTKQNDRMLQVVRLHHSILQELECMNVAFVQDSIVHSMVATSDIQKRSSTPDDVKQFALAPLSKWHRRFVRFDITALNRLRGHPIHLKTDDREKKKKKNAILSTTSEIFNKNKIRFTAKEKRGIILAPTFTTDGIQLHLAWQTIVTLSCKVDPKKKAIRETKEKKKMETKNLSLNGQIDKRTLKKVTPTLSGSDGPRFWKKTTRLEEHDYGIFQSASLLASRSHAQEQGRPFSFSDLPFKHIVAVDPGHINIISTAKWDFKKHDWVKGRNLTKCEYYRELGQQHNRRRTETRMKREALGKRVAQHMDHLSKHSPKTSSPDACLQHLLYASGACWDDMFAFHGSRNAARNRFRSDQKRQRLVSNLIEHLAPEHLKSDSIIVLGSATFATSMKGSQSTPIGRLIKELAKRRRIVLVDEYFTTQMCSGCNVSGIGPRHSRMFHKHEITAVSCGYAYGLRSKSTLCIQKPSISTKIHHVNHPTRAMASFKRTCESASMRARRIDRETQRAILFPPDPGKPARRPFDPLSAPLHGLKQCTHCRRFWNRDLNAARNIGWVFFGLWFEGVRPVHLRRHSKRVSDHNVHLQQLREAPPIF